MKPAALLFGLILAVAGCAQLGLPDSALSSPIPPSEVDWSRRSGTNTVTGLARASDR
jgi:hypothetical protein